MKLPVNINQLLLEAMMFIEGSALTKLETILEWNYGKIDARLNPITKKTGANLVRYSDQDIESARYILKLIESKFFTMTKQPDLEKWAEDIRKLREIDGHTGEEIAELFTWAHNDSFWSTNIRSPSKLRKQWDTLKVRMQNGGNNGRYE